VLPAYEGRGIGRELLSRVVADLRACGAARIWLAASADPRVRAYGFYRANGWKPVGRMLDNGDEELELREGS
jgi:ribosomal protein S18 acetylase RimI-like enzyme